MSQLATKMHVLPAVQRVSDPPMPAPSRIIDPLRPDVLDPRPLAKPLPLIACCNAAPPGCGYCFFCLARAPKPKAAR